MQLKRFTDLGLRVLVFLADKTDRPTALIDMSMPSSGIKTSSSRSSASW